VPEAPKSTLLLLLSPPHIRDSESNASRKGCRTKGDPTNERPWLDVLKSLQENTPEAEKRRTNTAVSSVEEISEPLVQRGAKSAKSPSPLPEEENSGVDTTDTELIEAIA
jgi:hypothetical protein